MSEEVACKSGVRRNSAKFTGKHLCQGLFFNEVAGLWHRCFPVNFAKFLRTPFYRIPPVTASLDRAKFCNIGESFMNFR